MSKYNILDQSQLRQKHVEAWADEFNPLHDGVRDLNVQYAGQSVRAAINAGIVEGLTIEELGEMLPQEVHEISSIVSPMVMDALRVVDPS